jgi:hypothetical protein
MGICPYILTVAVNNLADLSHRAAIRKLTVLDAFLGPIYMPTLPLRASFYKGFSLLTLAQGALPERSVRLAHGSPQAQGKSGPSRTKPDLAEQKN